MNGNGVITLLACWCDMVRLSLQFVGVLHSIHLLVKCLDSGSACSYSGSAPLETPYPHASHIYLARSANSTQSTSMQCLWYVTCCGRHSGFKRINKNMIPFSRSAGRKVNKKGCGIYPNRKYEV